MDPTSGVPAPRFGAGCWSNPRGLAEIADNSRYLNESIGTRQRLFSSKIVAEHTATRLIRERMLRENEPLSKFLRELRMQLSAHYITLVQWATPKALVILGSVLAGLVLTRSVWRWLYVTTEVKGYASAMESWKKGVEAITEPLPTSEEPTAVEVVGPNVRTTRVLRFVLAAARVEFGSVLPQTEAVRNSVSRFVREYMKGKHGSVLNMPDSRVALWEPLVTAAVMTPPMGAILAAETANRGGLAALARAYGNARRPLQIWDVLFGTATWRDYLSAPRNQLWLD